MNVVKFLKEMQIRSRGTDTNGGGGESGGACLIMAKVQNELDVNSEHLLLCIELQV